MPRGWKQRREYKPGAPLYAKLDLKFSGRPVKSGELIPPEYIRSARDHLRLWRSGHASHEPRNKYSPPPPQAAPATPSEATVQSPEAARVVIATDVEQLADAELEKLTRPAPAANRPSRTKR